MLSSSPYKIHEPLITGVSPRPTIGDQRQENCETREVERRWTGPKVTGLSVGHDHLAHGLLPSGLCGRKRLPGSLDGPGGGVGGTRRRKWRHEKKATPIEPTTIMKTPKSCTKLVIGCPSAKPPRYRCGGTSSALRASAGTTTDPSAPHVAPW